MKRRHLATAVLAFAAVLACACGEAATLAEGVVLDTKGNPVEGVEVVMESEIAGGYRKESEQKTGTDGKFNFVTITGDARVVRLRFEKEGFRKETKSIPALEKSSHRIVLDAE